MHNFRHLQNVKYALHMSLTEEYKYSNSTFKNLINSITNNLLIVNLIINNEKFPPSTIMVVDKSELAKNRKTRNK